jgi:hypothetical protein
LGGVVYQHRQEQPYTLVICEKPAAALRIAEALGTANLKILRLDVQTREKNKKTSNARFPCNRRKRNQVPDMFSNRTFIWTRRSKEQ